jgi:hypothetical protein
VVPHIAFLTVEEITSNKKFANIYAWEAKIMWIA